MKSYNHLVSAVCLLTCCETKIIEHDLTEKSGKVLLPYSNTSKSISIGYKRQRHRYFGRYLPPKGIGMF